MSDNTTAQATGNAFLPSAVTDAFSFVQDKGKRAIQAVPNPLNSINIDRLVGKVPKGPLKNLSVRKMFRTKRGLTKSASAGLAGEHLQGLEGDESSDDDSDQMTEAQLKERIEAQYFDPNFDATRAELSRIGASYDDQQLLQELKALEKDQKQREDQLRTVNKFLQRKLLYDYDHFVKGMMRIHAVKEDLDSTHNTCRAGRESLAQVRQTYTGPAVLITRKARRRRNLRELMHVLESILVLGERNSRLKQLRDGNRFDDMLSITKTQETLDIALIRRVPAASLMLREWESYAGDPQKLLAEADAALQECFRSESKFSEEAYIRATGAYVAMEDAASGINRAANALFLLAFDTFIKVVHDMSRCERPIVSGQAHGIGQCAHGVEKEHILPCVCRMAGRALDIIIVCKRVVQAHFNAAAAKNASAVQCQFHSQAREQLQKLIGQMGVNVFHESIISMLKGFRYSEDLDTTLHIFYVVSLLIEATADLGIPKAQMASAREELKNVAREWVQTHFLVPRAARLVEQMANDNWEASYSTEMFKVAAPLKPTAYKASVKWVRSYVEGAAIDAGTNPFFDSKLTRKQNVADSLNIEGFDFDRIRCLATESSVTLNNLFFTMVCRIVARFPPLASEFCNWGLALLSLFAYIAGANFACHRKKPLEEEEVSAQTKATLKWMRTAALAISEKQSYDARNAEHTFTETDFPQAVFQQIRSVFGDKAHMYAAAQRMTALEVLYPVASHLEACLNSVKGLISPALCEDQRKSIEEVLFAAEELLHVGTHRVCFAWFNLHWLEKTIADIDWEHRRAATTGRSPSDENKSPRHGDIFGRLQSQFDHAFEEVKPHGLPKFPSNKLTTTFWRHFVFGVQYQFVKGFGQATRRLSSVAVRNMMDEYAEVKGWLQRIFGAHAFALPDYVEEFLSLYGKEPAGRLEWLRQNHQLYRHESLVPWAGFGGNSARSQAETALKALDHCDALPLVPFLEAAREDAAREAASAGRDG